MTQEKITVRESVWSPVPPARGTGRADSFVAAREARVRVRARPVGYR